MQSWFEDRHKSPNNWSGWTGSSEHIVHWSKLCPSHTHYHTHHSSESWTEDCSIGWHTETVLVDTATHMFRSYKLPWLCKRCHTDHSGRSWFAGQRRYLNNRFVPHHRQKHTSRCCKFLRPCKPFHKLHNAWGWRWYPHKSLNRGSFHQSRTLHMLQLCRPAPICKPFHMLHSARHSFVYRCKFPNNPSGRSHKRACKPLLCIVLFRGNSGYNHRNEWCPSWYCGRSFRTMFVPQRTTRCTLRFGRFARWDKSQRNKVHLAHSQALQSPRVPSTQCKDTIDTPPS